MPAGFEKCGGPDGLRISYRLQVPGWLLGIFAVAVTLFMLLIIGFALWDWSGLKAFVLSEWWVSLAFVAGALAILNFGIALLRTVFGRTVYLASRGELIVREELFVFHRDLRIPGGSIERFEQTEHPGSGEGEVVIRTWNLEVCSDGRVSLITSQPSESCEWLGRMLAGFYQVEFRGSE